MANMIMAAITTQSLQSSIEVATRRNARLFAVYIAVLVVTALLVATFTWLTWDSGNKVNDAVQGESNARIQEAKATASQADERSKGLEKDNLTLRGQVATLETNAAEANKNLAGLQKAAADAKAAQQRVEIDLAKQQERAAKAEKDLAQLKLAVQPRRITAEQQPALIDFLRLGPKGKASITCVMGDGEGNAFATDVAAALKAAGWDVEGGGISQAAYAGGNPIGFVILVRNAIGAPPFAAVLQRAFFSIGIPLPGEENPQIEEGKVQIIVGNKPN